MTEDEHATPPTLGPTGSPVVAYKLNVEQRVETYRYNHPPPPARELPTRDDEGVVIGYRTLSDQEFSEATQRYEALAAEWKRTMGVVRRPGPETVHCYVTCEDGSKGVAELRIVDGGTHTWREWRWLENWTPGP
jgi:hypothetical protein